MQILNTKYHFLSIKLAKLLKKKKKLKAKRAPMMSTPCSGDPYALPVVT